MHVVHITFHLYFCVTPLIAMAKVGVGTKTLTHFDVVVVVFIWGQINSAKQAAQETKDQARELQDQINDNKDALEREKNKTRELIKQVKDYLTGECPGDTKRQWSSPV